MVCRRCHRELGTAVSWRADEIRRRQAAAAPENPWLAAFPELKTED
jgi:hypothetical protein